MGATSHALLGELGRERTTTTTTTATFSSLMGTEQMPPMA